jgi:hypothetical protein
MDAKIKVLKYEGHKKPIGGCTVCSTMLFPDGKIYQQTVLHIERHSPDGMQWGYGGSGPADCALSILTHFIGHDSPEFEGQAELLYQKFKFEFIANQKDDLLITRESILEWLNKNRRDSI